MLNALGLQALARHERQAAISWFEQAIAVDGENATAYANLGFTHLSESNLGPAEIAYRRAIALDPSLAIAHHGLAQVYGALGDTETAAAFRENGLRLRPVTTHRFTGRTAPLDVLLLGTPSDVNIDTRAFFDASRFRVSALSVDHFGENAPLPPHHFIFNAIGEADAVPHVLAKAARLVARSGAHVFNDPQRVLQTGRVQVARTLGTIAGVRVPRIMRCSYEQLCAPDRAEYLARAGIGFPFLLRIPGLHAGKEFQLIAALPDLHEVLDRAAAADYFVIEFIPAQSADGAIRKFRVLHLGGELFPIHLAISKQWKVHYFSAQTTRVPAYQAEEERFLRNFANVLGPRVIARLRIIFERLGLDYAGIDFAVDEHENVLVFEANASMGFLAPGNIAMPAARGRAAGVAAAALRAMFERHCAQLYGVGQ
jgi:hypothetical protein